MFKLNDQNHRLYAVYFSIEQGHDTPNPWSLKEILMNNSSAKHQIDLWLGQNVFLQLFSNILYSWRQTWTLMA